MLIYPLFITSECSALSIRQVAFSITEKKITCQIDLSNRYLMISDPV